MLLFLWSGSYLALSQKTLFLSLRDARKVDCTRVHAFRVRDNNSLSDSDQYGSIIAIYIY